MNLRQAAVIGHPVAHSLSPVMHRAAYAALDLPEWTYDPIDVAPGELGEFVSRLDSSWAGLSVTMPHKRDIQTYLVGASELATHVGAVNTVVVEAESDDVHGMTPVRLRGYNTDVYGIVHALAEAQGTAHIDGAASLDAAVILGGGATAAAAMAAVREHGCRTPVVAMRSPDRAGPLLAAAARLGVTPQVITLTVDEVAAELRALGPSGAVISTLPSSAADPYVDVVCSAVAADSLHGPVLLDVVYDPWPTALARAWGDTGRRLAGGFAMLVHQAEGQVRLMTGRRPPIVVMRAAGQAELDRRSAHSRS